MIQTNKKGCKELLMQRMFLAIIWSIAVQFIFLSCLLLITNLSLDYTRWLQDTWATVISFRMWSYYLVLATVTFLQGVICSKSYLNSPPYLKSRFTKFCAVFTSQNVLLGILYVTIGGLLVWLHLSLYRGKYSSLTTTCNIVYGTCLVEEHFFLLLSGLWSGLYFFAKTSVFQVKYLKFPIIPLSKFTRVKQGIYSMLPSLMVTSVWPTFYYLNAYYFLGSYCRSPIFLILSAQLESEPLDTLPRLVNLSLIFHLWLYQLVFALTINTMYLLFEVYLTEWIPFEFRESNVFNNESSAITLPEALSMDKIPIMQHLGYLDLVTLAQKDKARRNVLFTLSQPGGHPYNWNCILEKCVALVKKFSEDLNVALLKSQEHSPPTGLSTSVTSFQKEYIYHMRNLVTEKPQFGNIQEIDPKESQDSEPFIHKFVKTKWQNFIAYLLSKPLIHYVFGEQESSKVCHILFNGQAVVWAVDALSSLAVLSLSEDSYGIVQKDLPLIINTLLALKQSLDKLQKSNILAKKQRGNDEFNKQVFTSLRTAIKRSLYRIVTSFEVYIADLTLEPSAIEQIQNFVNYRE